MYCRLCDSVRRAWFGSSVLHSRQKPGLEEHVRRRLRCLWSRVVEQVECPSCPEPDGRSHLPQEGAYFQLVMLARRFFVLTQSEA